jgi:hypothetical protein
MIPATTYDPSKELNAFARINDVGGDAWIVDAKRYVAADDAAGLDRWIEEGHAAASRDMTLKERGYLART